MVENMAVKNYYEILGVAETAAKAEIKRAYFGMVRQYPPEKEPEKFKEYRKAYEVLFDENSRKEYDSIKTIPTEYSKVFDYAQQMMAAGEYEYAIDAYKRIIDQYPDLLIVNCMLADAYSLNDNTGNAVKIYEKIVKLEPDNMAYQKALGDAYVERGFNKKALTQYHKTLKLEPDNLDLYVAIIKLHLEAGQHKKAREYLSVGLQCAVEHGLDNTALLVCGSIFSIQDRDKHGLNQYLEQIAAKMAEEPLRKEAIAKSLLTEIFNVPPVPDCQEEYFRVFNFVSEQVPEMEGVQMMQQEIQRREMLNDLERDDKIPDVIVSYTQSIIGDCDCPSCQVERLAMEMDMLQSIAETRKALHYLRNNYPDIFSLNADFYNDILNSRKERSLFEKLFNKYKKYQKRYPEEFFDEDDWDDEEMPDNEPYVRKEQKIGRNDPCPCGSGKKYKKCCGAN